MATTNDLNAEIARILEAPYACNLQNLHSILNHIDREDLQIWAHGNNCRLECLASVLLDGLSNSLLWLNIMQILSSLTSFRDAVLKTEPSFLDTLLRKSTESDQDFTKFGPICISFLSSPLQVALPTRATSFVSSIIIRVTRQSSEENIRHLHQVFLGSGLGVLDTIDAEVVIRSQEEIKKALQRPEASHPTNLLGLAILAILATRPPSKSRATGSSHLTDRNETYTGNISIGSCQSDTNRLARQFFATAKAQKTIDIAVVMAIQSCSRSCAINRLEALEMLRLSKEIIQACNPSEKQKWMNKNPGHAKRLYERATRHDLEPNARLEILDITATLLDDQTAPADVVSAAETVLLTRVSALLTSKRIDKYIALFSESSIQSHILSMIDLSNRTDDVSSDAVFNLVVATHLASMFVDNIAKSVIFRRNVLRVTATHAPLESLTRFISSRSSESRKIKPDNGVDICPWTLFTSRRKLQKMVCSMLLNAAIFSNQDEIGMNPSVISSLLEKYANLGDVPHDCILQRPASQKAETALISLFGTQNISKEPKRIDWRAQLIEDLARDANSRYQSIVSTVSEVCQELELRCNNAERPLREEQDRVHDLHSNLQTSIARIAELESENQSYTSALESLKYEKGKLKDQIKPLEAQLRRVQLEAQNVRDTLEDAVKRAENVIENQATVVKEERLKHLAALAEKDEICEEQTLKLRSSESCLNELRQAMEQIRGSEKRDTAEIARLQELTMKQSDLLKTADMLVVEKEALILQYHKTQAELKEENQTLSVKLKESSSKLDEVVAELATKEFNHESKLAEIQSAHAVEITAIRNEQMHLQRSLEADILELRQSRQQLAQEAAMSSRRSKIKIVDLENKATKLEMDLDKQASKLAEAQELRRNVLAIVAGQRKRHNDPKPQQIIKSSGPNRSEYVLSEVESVECKVHSPQSTTRTSSSQPRPIPKRDEVLDCQGSILQYSPDDEENTRIFDRSTQKQTSDRRPLGDLMYDHNGKLTAPTPAGSRDTSNIIDHTGREMKENLALDIAENASFYYSDLFSSVDRQAVPGVCRKSLNEPLEAIEDDTTEL